MTTATCILLCLSPVVLYADGGNPMAEFVLSRVVRERSDNRSMADIAVFKSRLFLSFLERCDDSDRSCIRVMTSEDGAFWKTAYKLPKYAPRRGFLFFVGDRAYFLRPRYGDGRKSSPKPVDRYVTGELGTSAPPYKEWTWKEIDNVICSPHVVHVPGKGVFAVVEFRDAMRRTSFCRLELETGKLTELLNFGDLRREQTGIDRHTPFGASILPSD